MLQTRTNQYLNILHHAWSLSIRNWQAIAGYALFIWVCGSIVLLPLATWLLHLLAVNDDVIISNYNVPLWLATPQGLACVFLVGSLTIFTYILYLVGFFEIMLASITGKKLSVVAGIKHVLWRLPNIFLLSLELLVLCIPAALVMLSVPGLVYLLLLTKHDINFYLSQHPPEWVLAVTIDTIWITAWVIILFKIIMRLCYIIPIWIEGGSLRKAARVSWNKTKGQTLPIFMMLLFVALVWGISKLILNFVSYGIAGFFLAALSGSIIGVITVILVHGGLSVVVESLLLSVSASWMICVLLIVYRRNHTNSCGYDLRPKFKTLSTSKTLAFRIYIALASITFLVAISWLCSLWIVKQQVTQDLPLIIAHRAGAAYAPENSLAAMKKTMSDNVADIIEIDVTPTLDGQLVILHDKDLMRLAGDERIIRDTNYRNIRDVDIGKSFSDKYSGEKIALLEDCLKLMDDRTKLILDFKHGKDTDIAKKTIEAVRSRGLQDNIIIMSLELEEVRLVQKLAPEIKVGYFASLEVGDVANLEVDVIGAKDGMITKKFIKTSHAQGTEVYAWTIDDPMRMLELIEAGVDGIITNDPLLAGRTIVRVGSLSPSARTLLKFRHFWKIFKKLGWYDSVES